MRKWLIILAVLAIAAWFGWRSLQFPEPPDYQLFYNGTILTMNDDQPQAEAVALEGDRILAVGTKAEAEAALAGRQVVLHDLDGRTMLPGFVDAHSHFPSPAGLAADLNSPPVGTLQNIDQAIRRLTELAAEKDPGDWVIGMGFDDTLVTELRHMTREDLDRVSTEHPVYVMHVSGHFGSANSMALELAGITDETPDPEGGIIRRDASGRVNGVLEETAREAVITLLEKMPLGDFVEMIRIDTETYARAGVTTAQAGLAPKILATVFKLTQSIGMLPLRMVFWSNQELGEQWLHGEFDPEDYNSPRLSIGAVKLVSDGSIQGYTGYLGQPYHLPYHGDESYRGYPTFKREELARIVTEFHEKGLQLAIHANGDAAIDDTVAAIEAAQRAFPREDPRHIIIHAQMATDEQLARMKVVGATPSFFSAHTYYWGDRHQDMFMGPERAARMSPTRSALDIGLRFSVHLDAPVVPMSPLTGAWTTVNRRSSSGRSIGPEQRVDAWQALKAVTIEPAWQMFLDKDRGSLEPGKLADLVILDSNPLDQPELMNQVQVLSTWVGGVPVYPAPGD